MKRTFILLGFWGLAVLLMFGSVQAEMGTPEVPTSPAEDADISRPAPEADKNTELKEFSDTPSTYTDNYRVVSRNGFLPLRQVIRQFTGKTGIQIKLSHELQEDDEALKKLYYSQDDTWLEEFSRVEYDNQPTGKKEIILLKSRYYDASAIPDSTPRPPRAKRGNPARRGDSHVFPQTDSEDAVHAAEDNDGGLPREKLFKLMRFPFKGPFSDEWFQDEEYRQFLVQFQIHSPKDFEDRKVIMKIRNEARKLFRAMRSRR